MTFELDDDLIRPALNSCASAPSTPCMPSCISSPPAAPKMRFYGEHELNLTGGSAPEGAPCLLGAMLAASSSHQRERLVRSSLQAAGFEWMSYTTLRSVRGEWKPQSMLTTYSPSAWTRRYFSERYQDVDPRLQRSARSLLPFVWDRRDLLDAEASSNPFGRLARFVADLCDCGLRSGVFLRLPPLLPGAEDISVISLTSSRSDRSWIGDEVLGQALTIGLCMHEFLSRHVHQQADDAAPFSELSPLQQRILQCLQHGQSDKEIAFGLKLSSHAVDYHMRQLRRRFAVRNRVQLVNATS